MPLQIEQFMCRSDNFCVLVHDPETGSTVAIDAPENGPIRDRLAARGWTLTHIFITHHHGDHVEAVAPLKAAYGCEVVGPAAEAGRIDGLDRLVGDGDHFDWAGHRVEVISTPGHTAGHVCYHLPDDHVVFTADTLFALGCGRLFERGPQEMFTSLSKLAALPPETAVYCGHEYTLANARFAVTVDPDNSALAARLKEIEVLRGEDKPTLPTTIGRELETNPFLRWGDPAIRAHLGMSSAEDWEVLAEIRKRKDNF